ncbi:NAD(P)-dependent dehydrogenase, short-chain alcohol dehydrogenase family [Variovorax sp. HW608]|uniref:SDR family oxidoreductase n=1 Tax=Variovorax sp. HW608 TaxID=1034889 RepID=UPI00082008AD|nr:SDR family oxidoreductase [Variovorax sp. HW608]SCK12495.1 NAD(P)-dependent dehydrogenase, short-chain alcohol dehydrogenase family [Variovorax sp. HW608]
MQTVLITGAASGIGRDAARLFATAGWQCVLVDHNEQALYALGRTLPSPACAAHVLRTVDLTDAQQVASLRDGTPALDAILNNAGMSDASNTPLAEQAPAQMARLLALNLAAPAAVVDACTPLLKPGARIVNVASGAGLHAIPWRGAYSPSKAGLIAQTRALAAARPEGCVTVLAPGFVRTELVDGLIQAGRIKPENAVGKIPLGRMALPSEMAQALFFLASPGAAPLHGQVLAFNGGSSVFGGSQRFEPATLEPLPLDLPMRLEVCGGDAEPWQAAVTESAAGPHYDACLDLSPLSCEGPGLLQALHAAATRFHARHAQQASLTVLLPRTRHGRWQDAGDGAAARMLVSTLACEWGSRALRINALEVPEDLDPQSLHPLLRFVCGPAAQYLTGQTLVCTAQGEAR